MSSSVIRLAYVAIRRRAQARRSGGITLPDLDPGPGAEQVVAEALQEAQADAPALTVDAGAPPATVPETHTTRQAPPQGAALIDVDTITGAGAIPDSVTLTQRVAVARDIETGATVPLQLDLLERTAGAARTELAVRLVNVVIAAALLVLLSPVLLLIAAAIKMTSRGPVFYRQVRVGLDRRRYRTMPSDRRSPNGSGRHDRRKWNLCGRMFTMYKFRTMRIDAESRTGPVWARPADPRVTPIGGFLRACRLDELPQLYNVLKGDMNIVGPRPERPTIVVELVHAITEYPIRQRTLPGITGLAQISQAPDGSVDDVRLKVRYDLEYMRRRSVLEDLRIMAKTPAVMFLKRTGR